MTGLGQENLASGITTDVGPKQLEGSLPEDEILKHLEERGRESSDLKLLIHMVRSESTSQELRIPFHLRGAWRFNALETFCTFGYHGNRSNDPDVRSALGSLNNTPSFSAVMEKFWKERNAVARTMIDSDPTISRCLKVLNAVSSPFFRSTRESTVHPNIAAMRAREDVARQYNVSGTNLDTLLATDDDARRMLGRREFVHGLDSSTTPVRRFMTKTEATRVLRSAGETSLIEVLGDLARVGAPIIVRQRIPEKPSFLRRIAGKNSNSIKYRDVPLSVFGVENLDLALTDKPYRLMIASRNSDLELLVPEAYGRYQVVHSLADHQLLYLLKARNLDIANLDENTIKELSKIHCKLELISELDDLYSSLDRAQLENGQSIKRNPNFGSTLDNLQYRLQKIKRDPGILLSTKKRYLDPDKDVEGAGRTYGTTDVYDYVQWRFIHGFDRLRKPLFKVIDTKNGENSFSDDMVALGRAITKVAMLPASAAAIAGEGVKSMFRHDELGHGIAPVTPEVRGGFLSVMKQAMEVYFRPAYVVDGHPLKNMQFLQSIKTLSTYDSTKIDNGSITFEDYTNVSDFKMENMVYIRPTAPVRLGYDSDRSNVIRCFTPPYARVNYINVRSGKTTLLLQEDFILQHDPENGHYRIAFTTSGVRKMEHGVVTYQLGVEDTMAEPTFNKVVDGQITETLKDYITPEIGGILIYGKEKMKRLSYFADQLHKKGFTVMADSLRALSEKEMISTRDLVQAIYKGSSYAFAESDEDRSEKEMISTRDLVEAIYKGSLYAFAESDEDRNTDFDVVEDSEGMLTYMPTAKPNGLGAFRCGHAAALYAELLNHVLVEEDEKPTFHATIVYPTLNARFGKVFAGGLHANTQAKFLGARFEDDATPRDTIHSYTELVKRRLAFGGTREEAEEVFEDYSPVDINEEIFQKELLMLQDRHEYYLKSLKGVIPKNRYTGQIPTNFRLPSSVVNVSKLYEEIVSDPEALRQNPERFLELLDKLEAASERWKKVEKLAATRGHLAKVISLEFGDFNIYSDTVIRYLEQLSRFMRTIGRMYFYEELWDHEHLERKKDA